MPLSSPSLFQDASSTLEERSADTNSSRVSGDQGPSANQSLNGVFLLLIFMVAFEAVLHCSSKGLWFDEVITLIVARQPHAWQMWRLLTGGVDGHPPTFHLIEHAVGAFHANERIVYRLPSVVAFLFILTALYLFLRKRSGDSVALVSASALLVTVLFDSFAFEARPYEMLVACVVAAIVCYNRADSIWWAGLFGLSLAGASCLHFYAAFAFFPFGLAELTILSVSRKFRVQVWIAFLAGIVPYAFFWPILHAQKVRVGAHFWATPSVANFARSLGELVRASPSIGLGCWLAAASYLSLDAWNRRKELKREKGDWQNALAQDALTLGFFAIPVVTFIGAKVAHGGMTGRYVITALPGISLALGQTLPRLTKKTVLSVGILVFSLFSFREAALWRYVLTPRPSADPVKIVAAQFATLPIVISDGLDYLPSWERSSEMSKPRLFAIVDPEQVYRSSGNDTVPMLLLTLRQYAPIHVEALQDFVREHDRFLVYSDGRAADYWPGWLASIGYDVKLLAADFPPQLRRGGTDPGPKNALYLVDTHQKR
jgi:mannosyltransferase